jgi:hypothetical protein
LTGALSVHLKLNDQAQRTVLCKDPFRSVDERVKHRRHFRTLVYGCGRQEQIVEPLIAQRELLVQPFIEFESGLRRVDCVSCYPLRVNRARPLGGKDCGSGLRQLMAARSVPVAELSEASAKIAQRVVECGVKRQDVVKSEQLDRPAGGGPFGDGPESR